MGHDLRDNLLLVSSKEEESLNGAMGKSMMGNGKAAEKTAAECGKELMDNHILENGKMGRYKALVYISWKMGPDIKDNSKTL